MIYQPGHIHGISHESDIRWLVNLPIATQSFVGDGKTTRFRLKYEARKFAGMRYGKPTSIVGWGDTLIKIHVERLVKESMNRHAKIDETDSRYFIIEPAPDDGEPFTVDYHCVEPL